MNKLKILIIDDDESFIEALELILKRDYECIHALSGEQGIDMMTEDPDFVFLDIDFLFLPWIQINTNGNHKNCQQ